MKEYGCCPKFKRGDNSTYPFMKRGGGMYLVSATLLNGLLDFVKLYTVVVHNLQMCMKEYRCCLKFRRGDNSTYTFTKRGGRVLVATPRCMFLVSLFWRWDVVSLT
jgi:hypothetical protein